MVGVVTDECRKALQMCGTAYTASLGSLTRYGWPPKIPWGLKHGAKATATHLYALFLRDHLCLGSSCIARVWANESNVDQQ
jgi:hypothetical protein